MSKTNQHLLFVFLNPQWITTIVKDTPKKRFCSCSYYDPLNKTSNLTSRNQRRDACRTTSETRSKRRAKPGDTSLWERVWTTETRYFKLKTILQYCEKLNFRYIRVVRSCYITVFIYIYILYIFLRLLFIFF